MRPKSPVESTIEHRHRQDTYKLQQGKGKNKKDKTKTQRLEIVVTKRRLKTENLWMRRHPQKTEKRREQHKRK